MDDLVLLFLLAAAVVAIYMAAGLGTIIWLEVWKWFRDRD